jgi:hypothetical protein
VMGRSSWKSGSRELLTIPGTRHIENCPLPQPEPGSGGGFVWNRLRGEFSS